MWDRAAHIGYNRSVNAKEIAGRLTAVSQFMSRVLRKNVRPDNRELVVYARTTYCPYLDIARKVFKKYRIATREIMIDQDVSAAEKVIAWTGFRSVPTIISAETGMDVPYTEPEPLAPGASPRGVNRGPMITEASTEDLEAWLRQEGFLK